MADRAGQQLGHYRLIRQLGRGGFADVYLGEHLYLNTPVAVKVLQTHLAENDLPDFIKEARTIAGLSHPHIIRVFDFGQEDDLPYLVMEYAPNGSLRQHYPKGTRLSLATISPLVRQVAEALDYAHQRRVIHRDVKPENMLLGPNMEVLLSDFGIALITQTTRQQTRHDVVGTAAYMSPEQLNGRPQPASDQYALGIVVYEWLAGDLPFRGTFTEVASQHILAPPPPLRQKIPNITYEV
ncbi:MAG TPA: serine/threonine-protein kinase, partial [Ktedonobacteraceae bacterium]|nr:serine/threonine-protein kinase [Ktedonobacteraceae bacterium]